MSLKEKIEEIKALIALTEAGGVFAEFGEADRQILYICILDDIREIVEK